MKKYIVNAINKIAPFIIFFFVSIIYAIPLFKNINNWGQMDWDQFMFWNTVPRETILRYHQLPLWNPYSNGGNVMLALPHSSFLSPFFILILLFGTVIGLKIQWAISLFLGMLGMFFLAGYFNIKKISRYLPAGIFMLSSHFTLHLTEGHVEWMAMAFLPWGFLFTLKAHTSKKYFFLAIFSLSLMILGGSVYVFGITVIFIIIYFILLFLKEIKTKYILSLSGIFLCTFLLCFIKLVPMLEFLKEHPRKIESKEKVDISLLPTMLLSRKQNFLYQNTKWTNPQERVKVNEREFEYGWHEYGAYIGFVPLVLAMVGVFFYFRQHLSLLIIGVLSLWISLGESAFYNLWGLLHKFPIYASLHVPSRFILGFIFCISIFAGLGLSKLESISRRKYYKLLISIIIGTVFFDLFLVNRHLLRSAFIIKPPRVDVCSEFRQRYINFDLFPEKSRSSMYPVFLSNSGIINSYEVVGVKKGNVKVIGELDYKGEAYIAGAKGDTLISYFSPNKILVNVKIKGSDILVVNQNFYRGWKVLKHGIRYAADSYNGLIATAVDQNDKIVTFYYMPISFLFGSIITSISFLSGTIFCIKLLKRCA